MQPKGKARKKKRKKKGGTASDLATSSGLPPPTTIVAVPSTEKLPIEMVRAPAAMLTQGWMAPLFVWFAMSSTSSV